MVGQRVRRLEYSIAIFFLVSLVISLTSGLTRKLIPESCLGHSIVCLVCVGIPFSSTP